MARVNTAGETGQNFVFLYLIPSVLPDDDISNNEI